MDSPSTAETPHHKRKRSLSRSSELKHDSSSGKRFKFDYDDEPEIIVKNGQETLNQGRK